jgi:phosphatidylethanolamine/phosphatidyl-N-methylethanolamine N-methyltransferase
MSAVTFLREFLRDPKHLGAVAPSGRALARRMVDAAALDDGQVIVELGAGTGPMTAEILSRGVRARFVALEPNTSLAEVLRTRFPGLDLSERPAQEVGAILAERGWPAADRVVSSLPWAIWPEALQREVLDAVVAAMKPGARLVTFGYLQSQLLPGARTLRALLAERFETVQVTSVAWLNLPPALVLCCTARG